METFIEFLSNYLVDNDMSIRAFCKLSGVPITTCSEILKGAEPTMKNVEKIANYFDCSLDYLFGISNVRKTKNYNNINMDVFLARYDELLTKNKISHWHFAKSTGLSESARRRWRKGDIPKVSSLVIIARELGSSIDYLTGRV